MTDKTPIIKRLEQTLWKSSHVYFRDNGLIYKGAKTRQFSLFDSRTQALMGYIKWYTKWAEYCFFPLGCIFNKEQIREIAQFCEEVTTYHKSRLPGLKKRAKKLELARRKRKMERLGLTKTKEYITIENRLEEDGSCIPVDELLQRQYEMQVVEGNHENCDAPNYQGES